MEDRHFVSGGGSGRKLSGAALMVHQKTMEIFDEAMHLWKFVGSGKMSEPGSDQPDRGAEHITMMYTAELEGYKDRHPMPKLADAMRSAGAEYHYQYDQPPDWEE